MVKGQFVNNKEIEDALAMLRLASHQEYRFETGTPFIKGFRLPDKKAALVIVHELTFRSETLPADIDFEMTNPQFVNQWFDRVVDIRSHALLVHNNAIVYYRNNRVEFEQGKAMRKQKKMNRVYERILNNLYHD